MFEVDSSKVVTLNKIKCAPQYGEAKDTILIARDITPLVRLDQFAVMKNS